MISKSIQTAAIVVFTLLAQPVMNGSAEAQDKKLAVTDPNPIKAGLDSLAGKSVTLQLGNGQELTGSVEEVGSTVVRITQLSGREFFSALVRIDEIRALIYRAK